MGNENLTNCFLENTQMFFFNDGSTIKQPLKVHMPLNK